MHNVGPDIDRDQVASFTIRDTVDAIPCPEGAVVTDKDGNQLASYADKCYVVIDGEDRFIVSAYVFDGLYSETSEPKSGVTTADDIAAAHAQATPVTTAAQAATPTGPSTTSSFTTDAATVLSELTPEQRDELRDALAQLDSDEHQQADTSTETGSTDNAADATGGASTTGADVTAAAGNAGPAETSSAATPSVAELSAGDTGQ